MKYFLFLSIFTLNSFILLSAFFKQNYNIDIMNFYYPYCIAIAILNFVGFASMTIKKAKIKISLLFLFAFSLILISSFLFSDYKDSNIVQINFYLYFIWSVPAAIAGIYFSDVSRTEFEKAVKALFFLNSISLIFTLLIPYLKSNLIRPISIGLMNYQNATYITAFTIGLGLYFISISDTNKKFIYILIIILLLPIIFIGAGRGGALLLITYILLTLFNIFKSKKINIFFKFNTIAVMILCSYFFYKLALKIDENNRIFAYITSEGIDLNKGASGRDLVYKMDFDAISNSPVYGYGFFNYYQLTFSVPHNLFLEILLIGGLILGFIAFLFIIYLIYRIYITYSIEKPDKLVIYIFVYPLILLMFSTNFLVVSEFWFSLFYFLSRGRKNKVYN